MIEESKAMKPERNGPCPCGSGKKYKKCCYLKELGAKSAPVADSRENAEKDALGDSQMWLGVLNRVRSLTLNRKPHIKEYNEARKLHEEIVSAMVKYHEDGKYEISIDPDYVKQHRRGGRDTFYAFESGFDLGTREGTQGLYDMLIYKTAPNIECITEVFIKKHRYREPEKIEFLQSMLDSRLGLFEVTGTESAEGYAHIREVFTGEEYKITDIGLSGSGNYDSVYMYTRIIIYKGISFNLGPNLIFDKADIFIKSHIARHKKDYSSNGEFIRFMQLYNHQTGTSPS